MRKKTLVLSLLLACATAFGQSSYDLVIVGGNPGGIMAAISAARMGKKSVILERTRYVGGLPANGLGATDIATRAATTGLFREFVDGVKQHYIDTYGPGSEQVKVCSDGYHFEPSVGARIFQKMLDGQKDKITVLTMRQFDAEDENIVMRDNRIEKIRILNRETGEMEEYTGSVFLDATYEGDLGAAAGVPFRVGREGKDEFGEPGAGRVYKYWGGPEGDGSTFKKDNAVQSYNYRLCLTNNPANRVAFTKPARYNREDYASIVEDVWTGRNTDAAMQRVTPEMMEENRKHIKAGNPSKLPGDKWGIAKITNIVHVPNMKTDANNQHGVFVSTCLRRTGPGPPLRGNGATSSPNVCVNTPKAFSGSPKTTPNCPPTSAKQQKNGDFRKTNMRTTDISRARSTSVKAVVSKVHISLPPTMPFR